MPKLLKGVRYDLFSRYRYLFSERRTARYAVTGASMETAGLGVLFMP
jgi:hypothetical protein